MAWAVFKRSQPCNKLPQQDLSSLKQLADVCSERSREVYRIHLKCYFKLNLLRISPKPYVSLCQI